MTFASAAADGICATRAGRIGDARYGRAIWTPGVAAIAADAGTASRIAAAQRDKRHPPRRMVDEIRDMDCPPWIGERECAPTPIHR
jgi:hypothetical protein